MAFFVWRSGTICAILEEKQLCEIIPNLDQWFRRKCLFKIFLFWSSGGPFVQRSRTISAILGLKLMKNTDLSIKLQLQKC